MATTTRRSGPGEEPEYFDSRAVRRQLLLWCVATRGPLEQWEHLVARSVALRLFNKDARRLEGAAIWQMEISRHFALVAARNLLRALDLNGSPLAADSDVGDEVEDLRNLVEHWDENMPVFNVRPREEEPPRRAGKRFTERHPNRSPYDFWSWKGRGGAMLSPTLSSLDLHGFLDQVEQAVLDQSPDMARFVPERQPSPWVEDPVLGVMPKPDLR